MKLLILGGTSFLGRHLADLALAAGHAVTLFNRGQTNPDLFPQAEHLTGDRDGNLNALRGRSWDAVIDTCGYVPRLVRDSAELLKDAVEHYTFISTISVYAEPITPGSDESAPVIALADPTVEAVTGETYGGLKVLCEQAVDAALPGRVLHVRSGLIVGPNDPTDRFTYWPVRVAMGGEILAPGKPEQPTQFIDVRDLSAWTLRMTEARHAGLYNVTGPAETMTLGALLQVCQQVSGSEMRVTWVDDDFLVQNDVAPFSELPLWIPGAYNALQMVNLSKVLATGITYRPLADTVADTLRWNATRVPAEGDRPRAGMMQERETTLLAAWKARGA